MRKDGILEKDLGRLQSRITKNRNRKLLREFRRDIINNSGYGEEREEVGSALSLLTEA